MDIFKGIQRWLGISDSVKKANQTGQSPKDLKLNLLEGIQNASGTVVQTAFSGLSEKMIEDFRAAVEKMDLPTEDKEAVVNMFADKLKAVQIVESQIPNDVRQITEKYLNQNRLMTIWHFRRMR